MYLGPEYVCCGINKRLSERNNANVGGIWKYKQTRSDLKTPTEILSTGFKSVKLYKVSNCNNN